MKSWYTYIDNLNFLFWKRVTSATASSLESLAVYRLLTGFFLLWFNFNTFGWLKLTPQSFFSPPLISISILFPHIPGGSFFIVIDILLLLCLIFITLGIKTKLSCLCYAVLYVFSASFQFSFGKIDHSIFIPVLMLVMAFSGWGKKLALLPEKTSETTTQKAYSLLAVLLCFGFFSAGFDKAFNWINFDLSQNGTGSWYYPGYYTLGRVYLLAPYFVHFPAWGFKIMDFTAVAFELSSVFFLLRGKTTWRFYLFIASVFHFTNLLILNIPFLNLAIYYLAFVDFSGVYLILVKWWQSYLFKGVVFVIITISVLARLYYIFAYQQRAFLMIENGQYFNTLIVALIIWPLFGIILFTNFIRTKKSKLIN